MARNPELDHEFNENKEQKPYIFTVVDSNETTYGRVPQYTKGDQFAAMSMKGETTSPLKLFTRILLGAAAFAVGCLLMLLVLALFGNGSFF